MVQGSQLLIVLVVFLVLFGGRKLPQLARNLAEAQRELKKGLDDGADADEPERTGGERA